MRRRWRFEHLPGRRYVPVRVVIKSKLLIMRAVESGTRERMIAARNRMCLVMALLVDVCILSGKGKEGVVFRMYGMASNSVDTSRRAMKCWRVTPGKACICMMMKRKCLEGERIDILAWAENEI